MKKRRYRVVLTQTMLVWYDVESSSRTRAVEAVLQGKQPHAHEKLLAMHILNTGPETRSAGRSARPRMSTDRRDRRTRCVPRSPHLTTRRMSWDTR